MGKSQINNDLQNYYDYTITNDTLTNKITEGQDVTITITRTLKDSIYKYQICPGNNNHLSDVNIGEYRTNNSNIGSAEECEKAAPTVPPSDKRLGPWNKKHTWMRKHKPSDQDPANCYASGSEVWFNQLPKNLPGVRTVNSKSICDITKFDTTVYISTEQNPNSTADYSDYERKNITPVTFKKGESQKEIKIPLKTDNIVEGVEIFFVVLYKTKNDATNKQNHIDYTTVYIDDDPAMNYDYTITNVTWTNNIAAKEGQEVPITITRTPKDNNTNVKSTVYISTNQYPNSTADYSDYERKNITPITFEKGESQKEIKIPIKTDNIAEGEELFFVDLYKTKNDATNQQNDIDYTAVYIID